MSRQVDIKALVSHIVKGDGKDRCRICMGDTSEGQVFLGDTVMMDDNKPVTLAELLQVITGVEVTQDTSLPNSLCPLCYKSVRSYIDFKNLCHQSANHWSSTIEFLCYIPSYKFSKNTFKITAVLNEVGITINEEIVTSPKKSYTKYVKKQRRGDYGKSINCECPNCGKKFQYAQHLAKHLKESTDNQRACHLCAEIMSRDELVKHLKKVHGNKPYDCKKCLAIFHLKSHYAEHLSKAHMPGSCTCGDCGRSFQSARAFHAHTLIHNQKNCPNCSMLFRNHTCYVHHVKGCCNLDKNREDTHVTKHKVTVLVEGVKKAVKVGMRGSADSECICDYCHKKFAGKKFVAAHIQIVHLKNTHRPCRYCGKLLAAAHMPSHLKKHEHVTTYKCDKCDAVLKSKLGFQQHTRFHTGEKPYECEYCNEKFSASSRKSEHIRKMHRKENELKHPCDICPAKFRIPCQLKKHVDTVHKRETKFACNICREKFRSCRSLLMHTRNFHH